MKKLLGLAFAGLFCVSAAHADFTAKDASGSTITFKNSGTCTSVVCVVQQQPVDSTGAAFGVTGNPFFISFGTGVTLPAYAATPTFNLGTLNGAGTAANQSTAITALTGSSATTAHSCATAGYGLLGCLGQIDDDVKTGVGTPGSAPPANVIWLGANASGATGGHIAGLITCDNYVFKHITSATDTLAVQGVSGQTIYICGSKARAAGTATWFLENTASTNANCGSTLTQIDVLNSEVANSGVVDRTPFWSGLKNTSGNGLCINSTGTGGVDVGIYYAQF